MIVANYSLSVHEESTPRNFTVSVFSTLNSDLALASLPAERRVGQLKLLQVDTLPKWRNTEIRNDIADPFTPKRRWWFLVLMENPSRIYMPFTPECVVRCVNRVVRM